MKKGVITVLITFLLFAFMSAQDEETAEISADSVQVEQIIIEPPSAVTGGDLPNDAGDKIQLSWKPSLTEDIDGYEIYRKKAGSEEPWQPLTIVYQTDRTQLVDTDQVESNTEYLYRIRAFKDTVFSDFAVSSNISADSEWFKTDKREIVNLFFIIIFFSTILYYTNLVKRGGDVYIRPIAGLGAVDEAVGRATEMGKPILFVPGLSSIQDVATIAGLNILNKVAVKAAEYETPLFVPLRDFIVLPIAQEMVKEAYAEVGKEDSFNKDNVFFVSTNQFAYVAGVSGIMSRERPAANFFMGMFWAESLILTETGSMTGAIQIAGTDADTQLPFFITTCDYTLIGEELYAASAYLSKEPVLTATLKAQDLIKLILVILIILGTIDMTFNVNIVPDFFPDK